MRDPGTQDLPARKPAAGPSVAGPELRAGVRLGRYELLAPIARGGMAEVWIARLLGDLGFSRFVALKTILPEFGQDPSFRRSLFEEARLASRLRHANVVEVMELAEDGPILFQVMTWVEGDTLAELLNAATKDPAAGGLSPGVAVRIISDVLAGLHAAHELNDDQGTPLSLVHRDVSPQNVLVGADGVSRLTDFGVAKAYGRLADETQAGQVRGKPGYFAPEQIGGVMVDRRCDVFAAGIVVWEALVGRRLFGAPGGSPGVAKIGDPVYPAPIEVAPQTPAALSAVVHKALSKDRNGRYSTALELRDALEEAVASAGVSRSAKDVAEVVRALCGPKLEAQRVKLREASKAVAPALPARAATPASPKGPPLADALSEAIAPAGRLTPPLTGPDASLAATIADASAAGLLPVLPASATAPSFDTVLMSPVERAELEVPPQRPLPLGRIIVGAALLGLGLAWAFSGPGSSPPASPAQTAEPTTPPTVTSAAPTVPEQPAPSPSATAAAPSEPEPSAEPSRSPEKKAPRERKRPKPMFSNPYR